MAKFLVVHPYLDIYGGGERVCHNVIKTLVSHGQNVELLTFDFRAGIGTEILWVKIFLRARIFVQWGKESRWSRHSLSTRDAAICKITEKVQRQLRLRLLVFHSVVRPV